jgi:hypothetical protein
MEHEKKKKTGRTRRRPGLVAALAAGSLTLAAVSTLGSDPAGATVTGCPTPVDISTLTAGQAVTGDTVTSGTVPQSFNGQVLGVLHDGIATGVDMVLVKIDPAGLNIDPTEVKGIWEGMSGSPVYDSAGELIGAVAYGLSNQPSWVAGVTPYAQMDDYLGTHTGLSGARLTSARASSTRRVDVDPATARVVAAAADVTPAQAGEGMERLPMPLQIAGTGLQRLADLPPAAAGRHPWLATDLHVSGRSSGSSASSASDIVPGGNLAASFSYGDISLAAIGTATAVCDGDVVGFGHPAFFLGDTTYSMLPAEALYIQGDAPSYKVANLGDPVGTVWGDHRTGITGSFGEVPTGATISASAPGPSGVVHGQTTMTVRKRSATLANVVFAQLTSVHDRVFDGIFAGTEVMTWTVTGTDHTGTPFQLQWTDRYLSSDLSFAVSYGMSDFVWALADIDGITIDSFDATVSSTNKATSTYTVTGMQQRRAGAWRPVSRDNPAVARAGARIKLRVGIKKDTDGSVKELPFTLTVPKNSAGKQLSIGAVGGSRNHLYPHGSLSKLRQELAATFRHDAIKVSLGGVSKVLAPQDAEIGGRLVVPVRVR